MAGQGQGTNQGYCNKCGKTLALTNFYTYKDGSHCELCKACLTMHFNNWEPDTYLWIIEKFDYPYVEAEWIKIRDKVYEKDPYKITGMSVIGRYFSKMKLKQYADHNTWADTEYWANKAAEDAEKAGLTPDKKEQQLEEIKQAYENGEITEAQYNTYVGTQYHAPDPKYGLDAPRLENYQNGTLPMGRNFEEVELVDVGANLTQEDKVYLAMKWGRLYRADEWVALEQLYEEFMKTFDIQGAARIDTLKMICKTSLKMNQAINQE